MNDKIAYVLTLVMEYNNANYADQFYKAMTEQMIRKTLLEIDTETERVRFDFLNILCNSEEDKLGEAIEVAAADIYASLANDDIYVDRMLKEKELKP